MTAQARGLVRALDHHHRMRLRMLHCLELDRERLERNRMTLAGHLHRAEFERGCGSDLDRRRPSFARRDRGDQRTDLDRSHPRKLALHLLGGEVERGGLREKYRPRLRGGSLGIDETRCGDRPRQRCGPDPSAMRRHGRGRRRKSNRADAGRHRASATRRRERAGRFRGSRRVRPPPSESCRFRRRVKRPRRAPPWT